MQHYYKNLYIKPIIDECEGGIKILIHPEDDQAPRLYNLSPTLKGGGAMLDLGFLLFGPSFCYNFISTQYLENNFIEFLQILCIH